MIMAIYGASCTGKTTLGRKLAQATGRPFRSCGEVVKDRARALGVDIPTLALDEHNKVDKDTQNWCRANHNVIVEGRYLDQVLFDQRDRIHLILLTAAPSDRAQRMSERTGRTLREPDVRTSDQEDETFRGVAYSGGARIPAHTKVDTSANSVDACLELILATVS